jgi:hypothetical protein
LRRIAAIMAARAGAIADIRVGDCRGLAQLITVPDHRGKSAQFYQMLHRLGIFPARRAADGADVRHLGQLSIEQIIARLGVDYSPVRQQLIGYLPEQPRN